MASADQRPRWKKRPRIVKAAATTGYWFEDENGLVTLVEAAPGAAVAGQYVPVTDGDLVDPQPLYATNEDGVPVFAMVWVDF